MIIQYNTLTEAVKEHTPSPNPDQAATKILNHFKHVYPEATHLVLFVNNNFSSPDHGAWTCMVIGPGQSFVSLDEVDGKHLNDLPSQRQYPVAYVELNPVFVKESKNESHH